VRSEEAQGVVPPVVHQPAADHERLGDEVVQRQELDRVDPQIDQVLDDRRVGHPGVGAAQVLGDGGMLAGVALEVRLVDDHLVERNGGRQRHRRRGRGDHDAQRHGGEGVGGIEVEVRFGGVVGDRTVVVHSSGDRPRVRVQEELRGVEALAGVGVPASVHPEAVSLFRADARGEDVPDARLRNGHVEIGLPAVTVHQGEFDPGRAGRPEGEVGPALAGMGAERDGVHHRLRLVHAVLSTSFDAGSRSVAQQPIGLDVLQCGPTRRSVSRRPPLAGNTI